MPLKRKKKWKPRKRRNENDPVKAEEKLKRLEESRNKRLETIRAVKDDLRHKLMERQAIIDAEVQKERKAREKVSKDQKKSLEEKKMIEIRKDMKTIIEAGVKKVNAVTILPEKVKFDGVGTMTIGGVKYKLKNNVHLVGWGREALMLGAAFEKVIGKQLKKGWLIVPRKSIFGMWNYPLWFPKLDTRITYYEAGSNGFPDDKSVEATRKISEYCKKLKKSDILIVILSGGTDDLLCYPKGTISLKDKLNVLDSLKALNANPKEICTVRKKLSAVRGGNLARLAYPAKVITLILSDIPGDPIDQIAGAPTVNESKRDAALTILKRYKLQDKIPTFVRDVLEDTSSPSPDNLVDENKKFKFVDHYVIANINDALEAMSTAAFKLGLVPVKLSPSVVGTVREVSQEYARIASLLILAVEGKITKLEMYEAMKNSYALPLSEQKVLEIFPSKEKWGLGLCLLAGGRPAVKLAGNGKGGPNQELALYFSLDWYLKVKENPILGEYVVWFLGANSSGIDGNTKVAGAYGYSSLGPGIYKRFKKLTEQFEAAFLKSRNLERLQPDTEEAREALRLTMELESERAKLALILPDYVLKQNNANFLFMNVNDGDELLELGTGTGYTYTDVRDLHVIRIVRFQCNCDGSCYGQGEELRPPEVCKDTRCPVNDSTSSPIADRVQCCARIARPKIKMF